MASDPLARLLAPYRSAVAGEQTTPASIGQDPLLSLLLPKLEALATGEGGRGKAGSLPGGGNLLELIYGGNAFNPSSADSSHQGHLHVAGNKIGQLGKYLQSLGFNVGENPKFGGVDPVHSDNSWHYKGKAIDVNYAGGGKWKDESSALNWLEQYLAKNY